VEESTIWLPKPPLQSVSSIQYVDAAGDTQTLAAANYRVDADDEPARITPAYGLSWPTARQVTKAVTVIFIAGHTSRELIPQPAIGAMQMLLGHWFENRAALGTMTKELELGVKDLLFSVWHGGDFLEAC
jgi:uncharacterized phiE125 gp8 family phage protein